MARMTPSRVLPQERLPVPVTGDEKTMLGAFLDRYRETMMWNLDGVSTAHGSRRLVPSASTLLGIVKHLAYVERSWFQLRFAGHTVTFPWTKDEADKDLDFRIDPSDTLENITAFYQQEIARSRAIVGPASLDDLARNMETPGRLRW